ncbi:hypothetical protein B7L88_gp133 [Rhizobium phage RHEph10]|uniref:hypothetical protein n=1 Tax=Rhizobium phage RHEph10 TaxID=1220717 RepID=UPI0002AB0D50|nr:hypothetical protein B7L88_gp133 [Rhizobium phage RHEph10]AGC36155.1 hypothetical protein RHEph10_gp112 [Rhizobium phage RHEph10]
MKLFNCLSKKTQAALESIGDCWRLELGRKHIRIFVHDTLAASAPRKLRGDGDGGYRAELNVVSQIRRAARGEATSRRTDLTSAT